MLQLSHCIRSRFPKRIGRVMVRADEINAERIFLTVMEELRNPIVVGGRGSTYFERFIHALDGGNRVAVELEVVFLTARPESLEIRLIPNFKKPLAHLDDSVTFHPMCRQFLDQRGPLVVILRRGYVCPVTKNSGIS